MTEDEAIAQRVRAALARDEILKAMAIQVSVEEGIVTLRGAVPTVEACLMAEGLAGTTKGVELVDNELKVEEELPE